MLKLIKVIIAMLIIICPLSAVAKAESVTKINDLVENAKMISGLEVIIEGEAIGEELSRGNYSWININDGSNAIGVWISNEEADKINSYGNYKNIGDTVKIKGIFYRACKEHGGEADLHAISIEGVKSGHPVDRPLSIPKMIAAAVLSGAALLLFTAYQKIKANRNLIVKS